MTDPLFWRCLRCGRLIYDDINDDFEQSAEHHKEDCKPHQCRYCGREVPVDEICPCVQQMQAAAPELVEALEELLAYHVFLVESGDCGYWDADREPQVIKARAALAKARGEG